MNKRHESVIVGSGLSAFAASLALVERGEIPVILDTALTPKNQISGDQISKTRSKPLAYKSPFNSDYMYRYESNAISFKLPETPIHLSMAWGGLSTAWGTGIQPIDSSREFSIPNFVQKDLEEATLKILSTIPTSGSSNVTDVRFPWPSQINSTELPVASNRIKKILDKKNVVKAFGRELYVGQPRLAVDFTESSTKCTFLGNCLRGCPNNSLYCSSHNLDRLAKEKKITVVKGFVLYLKVNKNLITITYEDQNGKRIELETKKIFIAAGPLGTPMILQRSDMISNAIKINDSQVYYGALLTLRPQKLFNQFRLGQAIVCTDISKDNKPEIYLSIYESSQDVVNRVYAMLPKPLNNILFRKIISFGSKFILPCIGFLPEHASGHIAIDYDANKRTHRVSLQPNSKCLKVFRYTRKILRTAFLQKSLIFIAPKKFSIQPIGSGYHSGSSMPISENGSVDWNGNLRGYKNVYICDASVIPKIVTGAHTLGVMANSYRIAKNAQ